MLSCMIGLGEVCVLSDKNLLIVFLKHRDQYIDIILLT